MEAANDRNEQRDEAGGRSSLLPWLLGGAAIAAGAAYLNHRQAQQAEFDNPARGRFVEVDGVRLHHVDRGSGRPVVLLHGNGVTLEDMEASGLLDGAAARYRVIAFDRPGYGHSSRPRTTVWTPEAQAAVFAKAFRSLGIERPIVLGHSWGAMVALALALNHPEDISGVVLVSGYYFSTLRLDGVLASGPSIPVIGDVMRYTVAPPLARLMLPAIVRRMFAPAEVPESFARFPLEMSLRPSQLRASSAEAAMMVPAASRLGPRVAEIKLPTVIVSGDSDRIVPLDEQSQRLHEAIWDSKLHIVRGAGHMVHYFAPERVLAAIDEAARASSVIGEAD